MEVTWRKRSLLSYLPCYPRFLCAYPLVQIFNIWNFLEKRLDHSIQLSLPEGEVLTDVGGGKWCDQKLTTALALASYAGCKQPQRFRNLPRSRAAEFFNHGDEFLNFGFTLLHLLECQLL